MGCPGQFTVFLAELLLVFLAPLSDFWRHTIAPSAKSRKAQFRPTGANESLAGEPIFAPKWYGEREVLSYPTGRVCLTRAHAGHTPFRDVARPTHMASQLMGWSGRAPRLSAEGKQGQGANLMKRIDAVETWHFR